MLSNLKMSSEKERKKAKSGITALITLVLFSFLVSDYSRNLFLLKQTHRQRVFTTTIRNPTNLKN
jgi:hypothetical protein